VTLHPETQIVASAYDPFARVYIYTAQANRRRWTFEIKDADLAAVPKPQRRGYLARCADEAMKGVADG